MIFREIKFRFNIKFIFIKFIRGIIQNIFNRFGLKIVHFNNILIDINHLINKKDELIILDVGAYTGTVFMNLINIFPGLRFIRSNLL